MVNVGYPQKSTFGVLTANEVRTPIVNNPAGDLTLKRAGTTNLVIGNLINHSSMDLKIASGKRFLDVLNNPLIDPDDAGGITTLAPITGKATTAASKQKTFLTPAGSGCVNASGAYDETDGSWDGDANDYLFMDLLNAMPNVHLGGTVRLDRVTLFMSSTDNGAYVTALDIVAWDYVLASSNNVYTNDDDLGNGSTGRENKPYACDLELDPAKSYILRPNVVVGAGAISVYGFLLEWSIE